MTHQHLAGGVRIAAARIRPRFQAAREMYSGLGAPRSQASRSRGRPSSGYSPGLVPGVGKGDTS